MIKRILLILLICALYGISDKLHLLFVPGRLRQIRDVIIDSIGVITGIALFSIVSESRK